MPHVTNSENGCRVQTTHHSFPPEPLLRFSQRTCPIHYFSSKTHVWVGFAQFRCRTSPIPKTGVRGVHSKHEFLPTEPFLHFSQRTCRIFYIRSKSYVWGGLTNFCCRTPPTTNSGVSVHSEDVFLPPEPFLCFSQRTCPLYYFRSKTHGLGGFAQFRC